MNCYYCKGVDTMGEQNTRFCAYDIPNPFVMQNVPASVCRLCGDKSYSGDVVTALEKIKNGEVQVSGFQTFRVFDFKQLDKAEESVADSSVYFSTTAGFQKMSSFPSVEGYNGESGRQSSYVSVELSAPTLYTESVFAYTSSPGESIHRFYADIQQTKTQYRTWPNISFMGASRIIGAPSYDLEAVHRVLYSR